MTVRSTARKGTSGAGAIRRAVAVLVTTVTLVGAGGVTSAAAAPALAPPQCPTAAGPQRVVRLAYLDVLSRCPDAGGLAYWSQQPASKMALSLVLAPEVIGPQVASLYQTFYSRPATAAEAAFWFHYIATTHRIDIFFSELLGNGGASSLNNAQYVDGMYSFLLHRSADPAGRSHWLNYLNGGGKRSVMTLALFDSAEYWGNAVVGGFQSLLRRTNVDPGGKAYWTNILTHTNDQFAFEAALIASDEYNQVAQTQPGGA